jgi:hypothetical protein
LYELQVLYAAPSPPPVVEAKFMHEDAVGAKYCNITLLRQPSGQGLPEVPSDRQATTESFGWLWLAPDDGHS